ncbi:MAG: M12 family metallo-peptidase [Candidatus Kapabacteria bacterium]|nr:M12 family metallo-peptidase [Candidatus Kapabacteria bacterium]
MKSILHVSLTVALVLISCVSAHAQNTVDARLLFTPNAVSKSAINAQQTTFIRPMLLQHRVAREAFEAESKEVTLTNFPLPANESATLILERTPEVFDANTEFYTYTKDGKIPIRVRPIVSYRGTVNGDVNTTVSLHYSEGNITGYILAASGRRTVIGRDFSGERSEEATPHAIADEKTMFGVDPLSRFVCGNDELPTDGKRTMEQMTLLSKSKSTERVQADDLHEFRMAMVLREDIDSVMKVRGETDEEIAQYFMKIVAAMAQAYQQDIGAMLYVGYFEKFTKASPSGFVNNGRQPGQLLTEFSRKWSQTKGSVSRTVAHCYTLIRPSGGQFVGGIAFLDQMCNYNYGGGYGVSTMFLDAPQIPGDPNKANAFVWDVFVSAHEMGHNIGAYHTHSCFWNPPIDTCQLQQDGTDACLDDPSLRNVIPGTIMSYCHLVNGQSTPLTFGPRASAYMRELVAASNCTPLVTKPTVQITEPRGSESFALGEKLTIRWVSARVSRVNLEWGKASTGPWTSIVKNVNASDGMFVWTIPVVPSETFWIRIQDATSTSVSDTSVASYLYVAPVILDAPKGGERLGQGSIFTIRWSKREGVGNVKLEFAPDGTTYQTIDASSSGTSFEWTVPVILTSTARVKVSSIAAPEAPSTSGAFSIGVRRFALEIPLENSFICKNKANQYSWSSDFVQSIQIQYSTDDGSNWRSATQQTTTNATLGTVTSRNVNMNSVPGGTPIRIRVIEAKTNEVLDTRSSMRLDSCSLVSVDEVTDTEPFAIASVSPNPAVSIIRLLVRSDHTRQCAVVLVTNDGKEIALSSAVSLPAGSSTVEVSLNDVPSGSYQLSMRDGNAQSTVSVVVTR